MDFKYLFIDPTKNRLTIQLIKTSTKWIKRTAGLNFPAFATPKFS